MEIQQIGYIPYSRDRFCWTIYLDKETKYQNSKISLLRPPFGPEKSDRNTEVVWLTSSNIEEI